MCPISLTIIGYRFHLTASVFEDRPPPNPANHNLPFDCIFAETSKADGGRQTHNEIVVFHGQQVYPEFLVEFTAKEELAL